MKKIILLTILFYSLSGISQQLIIINNSSETCVINELFVNEFCMYSFPVVQPQYDMMVSTCPTTVTSICLSSVPTPLRTVSPFSAAMVADLSGIWPSFDFEYINFSMRDPLAGTMTLVNAELSTDPTVYYEPASCQPPAAPSTLPMPAPPFTGISQVYGPDVLLRTVPSVNATSGPTGLIYRYSWQTVFNFGTGKYDVEITIN